MQVPLSNIVALLFTYVAPSASILISILLNCTFLNGCIPTSITFFSSTFFYATTRPSTYRCSTPSSLSYSWIYIGSTGVVPKPHCSLELQPFFHLLKNTTIDVPNL